MTRKGLTQGELGEELGVCQETVSRWMSDQATPKLKRAVDIEALTGVRCREWFKPR